MPNLKQTAPDTSVVIDLGGLKVIHSTPANQLKLSSIKISSILDNAKAKKVVANVEGYPGKIVLWEGAAYDAIGQWTDADVANRIKEIYK
jgi:hypothetical protein